MVALLSLGALACDRPAPRPERELLFVTADSTFWVTATGEERRARGVPMLVARIGGRFTELYVTDDDRSYYDAVFIGHRLFARDLGRGDSVELHRDTVVAQLAADYAKAHPDDQPLSPDEPENDNAAIRASSDIEILGIHGIYLSYEHHTDVDSRDERSSDHRHQYRRGVLDTRDGSRVTLAQLFGQAVADTLAAGGRHEWNTVRDSAIARGGERVRKAVADFGFDAASFAIGSDGQSPTVRFAPPALSVNPDIEPIELQPRRVFAPTWWAAAAAELPLASGDSGQWVLGGDTLSVRLASAPRGWAVSLRIAGASERVVARVSSPVERVIWLDSTVSDAEREALARAFAEAGDYDGQRQIVSAPRGVTPFQAPLATPRTAWHLARHAHVPTFRQRQAGARVQARVVRADDAGRRERAWSRVWWRDPRDARQDGGCLRHAARPDALRHGIG